MKNMDRYPSDEEHGGGRDGGIGIGFFDVAGAGIER